MKTSRRKKEKPNVEKISPAQSSPRDDAPMRIPLSRKRTDESHYQTILDLADILLKPKTRS